MKKTIIVIFVLLATSFSVFASQKIIENGFEAFKNSGAEAAFSVWAKNGPLDGSVELKAQASQFGQIGAYYGKYVSHDYILTRVLSPNNKVIFLILNLEKGPLYGRFLLYKNEKGIWISPNFFFHTQPQQVWPSEMLINQLK